MPFLGLGIVAVISLIWAMASFFNIRNMMFSENQSAAPVGFDVAAFESDQQDMVAVESSISSSDQEEVLFGEIDRASDDISEVNDLALDEKSLGEEALTADISGDIKALDNGIVQNEIDQSINDVVQY